MPDFAFVLEDSLGHATHALNLKRALSRRSDVRATVIDVRNVPASGLWRLPGLRNWSFRASSIARRGLRARMAAGRPDAIFIHTQVAALRAVGIMRSVPTVVSLDATPRNFDEQGETYGHRLGHPAAEALKQRLNRRALLAARRLVTWSGWARDSLVRDYGVPAELVEVIHPGVDLSLFRPGTRRPAARPRLLFVGGDFVRKGGRDLLRAVETLADRVQLDIVTSAGFDVPPGLPVRVHRGLTPNSEELLALFREADVFVLPTRGECFAQVIPEAMASGLPIVATGVAGIPEMVRPGVNGFLVPPSDPAALAAALDRLAADPGLRAELGAASLAIARREHDAMANADRILALLQDVAGPGGARPAEKVGACPGPDRTSHGRLTEPFLDSRR